MSTHIKPSWKDAPPWAKSLAQDGDGSWYWYEDYQPVPSMSGSKVWCRSTSQARQMRADVDDDAWMKTLEHRP